jgi:hypothetical protein
MRFQGVDIAANAIATFYVNRSPNALAVTPETGMRRL